MFRNQSRCSEVFRLRNCASSTKPCRHSRPSNSSSVRARQYSSEYVGGAPLNFTLNATSADRVSLLISPGDMLSLKPVVDVLVCKGTDHKGLIRGKRIKKTSISGTLCARITAVNFRVRKGDWCFGFWCSAISAELISTTLRLI